MEFLTPQSTEEVRDLIREAVPSIIEGFGSKRQLGHQVQAQRTISSRALRGVLFYEPDEMVISVRAGTPLTEVNQLLKSSNQRLAFEPPDWHALFGLGAGEQTIGGVVACNHSGSRRLAAGACRDHVLGFEAVNGRAEIFKSGGRVVKNVTGYDLSKLVTGSFGTLAFLTEITLRTMPAPEHELSLVIPQMEAAGATTLFADLLGGPWEVVSAAWLPARHAEHHGHAEPYALIRLEGFRESVNERLGGLCRRHQLNGERLVDDASRQLWRALSNAESLSAEAEPAVWRISVPPQYGATLLENLPGHGWLDWAGGLIWLQTQDTADASAKRIREAISEYGGHATLVRASDETRARVPVFEPGSEALQRLQQRIRKGFDPDNLLNPGRMQS